MKIAAFLVALAGILALVAVAVIVNGYVLSVLWGWFIVTTFEARPLGVANAIGLACVVGYLTHQYRPKTTADKNDFEAFVDSLVHIVTRPAVALLAGWVVSHWVQS